MIVELRFFVNDISLLEEKFKEIQKEVLKGYSDIYFKPSIITSEWENAYKTLRLRTCCKKHRLLFSHIKLEEIRGFLVKRSLYSEDKLVLWRSNDKSEGIKLARDLGFEEWFSIVKSKAYSWKWPDGFEIYVEHIENLGWSGEIEVDIEKLDKELPRYLNLLDISLEALSPKPLAVLYRERG